MYSLKKGAIFGLDARIALAIFGALSVISGAALYSAIESAKSTALLTELKEIEKAHESYLLDTGSYLPDAAAGTHVAAVQNLVENDAGAVGWKGSYVSYAAHATSDSQLIHNLYSNVTIHKVSDDYSWGGVAGAPGYTYANCMSSTTDCNYYVAIEGMDSTLADSLDRLVDGSVDYRAGDVRVQIDPSDRVRVFLKSLPGKNPA
jgi:hypothetical protein